MPKSKFIFSLVRAQAPKKKLESKPNKPVPTNLTPLQIRIQPARRKNKGLLYEFVPHNIKDWPQQSKCYMQIWELDKWKKGRQKGKEHDASAQNSENELLVEFGGFIKKDGQNNFRFIADGPMSPSAPGNKQTKSIVFMIDMLQNSEISKTKVTLPVAGENESCFEIGVVCEKTAGTVKYKKNYSQHVYHVLAHDDCICYLSDSSNPSSRCGLNRIHYFFEAWFGHNSVGEDYYTFKYKNLSTSSFVSLGSPSSFEELLRNLGKDLSKTKNKNKKLGDIVILTHGHTHMLNNIITTVKMGLPLFSLLPTRSLPMWDLPKQIDADEINKLMQTNSEYYKYVDGKNVKDGLMSVVVKGINQHIDNQTHLWLTGCNLGLNKKLMLAIRRLFADKAVVYAFNKKHHLYITTNEDQEVVGGRETLLYGGNKHVNVWTGEGMQSIIHVP